MAVFLGLLVSASQQRHVVLEVGEEVTASHPLGRIGTGRTAVGRQQPRWGLVV